MKRLHYDEYIEIPKKLIFRFQIVFLQLSDNKLNYSTLLNFIRIHFVQLKAFQRLYFRRI